jgi:hypothetical protein
MWPRVLELFIACWLIISHFLLCYDGKVDFVAAALIGIIGCVSFRFRMFHLFQIVPISILLYTSYIYPTWQLPFSLQNFILTALTLLFVCILPSDIHLPPKEWRDFLKKKGQ